MISCRCGHWYNTKVPCPECGTKSNKIYSDEKYIALLNHYDKLKEFIKEIQQLVDKYDSGSLKVYLEKILKEQYLRLVKELTVYKLAYNIDIDINLLNRIYEEVKINEINE